MLWDIVFLLTLDTKKIKGKISSENIYCTCILNLIQCSNSEKRMTCILEKLFYIRCVNTLQIIPTTVKLLILIWWYLGNKFSSWNYFLIQPLTLPSFVQLQGISAAKWGLYGAYVGRKMIRSLIEFVQCSILCNRVYYKTLF